MTKRPVKLLPIWIAISAVLLIAGIVLVAVLGFNHSVERPQSKSFEVEYDVVVEVTENAADTLKDICDDALAKNGIDVLDFQSTKTVNLNNATQTGGGKLVYSVSGAVSAAKLESAKAAVEGSLDKLPEAAQLYVSYHTATDQTFYEAAWRGAIAIAVGAIVALIYVGVRFGIGAALTGLTVCAHDVLVTLAIFAITRIPVYYFAPMLIGAVAAVSSLAAWLVQCMKMRTNFKDPAYAALSAEDAVEASSNTARKTILLLAACLGAVLVVLGIALAVSGAAIGAILLPFTLLVPVAVSLYSSLLFGPALHVHVKARFDKLNFKRKKRYVGKEKTERDA